MDDVDFNNIVAQNTPPQLRQSKFKAWMAVIVSQLLYLYTIFKTFRDSTIYNLSITGQTIYIEKLLNDTFNSGLPGIYIQDNFNDIDTYLYNRNEDMDKTFLYNKFTETSPAQVYLYNRSESDELYDFIIMIPMALSGLNVPQLKTLVKKYIFAGKNYIIQYY